MSERKNSGGGRRNTGWYWPWIVVGLLALMALINAALVYNAHKDPSHAVEPDYYRKALDWDETAAQRKYNRELGWLLELDFKPVPEGMAGALPEAGPPNTLLLCRLLDGAGTRLAGAEIRVSCFHNAWSGHRIEAALPPLADGYGAALRLGPPGLWEFRSEVRRSGERFTSVQTRLLEAAAGGGAPEE